MQTYADLQLHLARSDAVVASSLLAVPAGLVVGVVIIAFRLITERSLIWAGVLSSVERYEELDPLWRIGLPACGGLAIGLLFQAVPIARRAVGPGHVMVALSQYGGRLPWPNAVLQFVGGAASIIAGHSVGREGPVIHVGAASASLLGQWLRLPNNSIRILVGCGTAAAIAASFNTPLAGVVFAMGVVMLDYTLAGFAPVILAAVSATGVSRLVFGSDQAFYVPTLQLVSLLELPWVLLVGAVIGTLAAAYGSGIMRLDRATRAWPIWLRMTMAGCLCGLVAHFVQEVMGLGYHTVQAALLGNIALASLIVISLAKLSPRSAAAGWLYQGASSVR